MNLLGQSLFKQMLAFRPADSVNENHLQPWWAPCTSESAGLPVVAKKITIVKEQRKETPVSQMFSLHWGGFLIFGTLTGHLER